MAKLSRSVQDDRNKLIYTLSLSQNELEVLSAILSQVAGDRERSYRKYAQGIADAVYQMCFWRDVDAGGYVEDNIVFKNGGKYI